MSDFKQQYALWDDFLKAWPASRLKTMTLDEYSQAGSKDSFTYWIESHLDEMGSIWGGSSFKFGVFSRKDTEDKKSDAKLSYSDTHGWYSSLGATAQEAFEKVRGYVAQVADLAARSDLGDIEAFDHLGEAFKWKIAFHYQDRQAPVIVDIFKRAPLAVYVGGTASQSMAKLQTATLAKRPANLGILEFGRQVNERIEALYDRDHGIGHAYLTGLAGVDDGPLRFKALAATFRNRIVPLLEEYFFEDWQKIRLVLADNQKSDTAIQFIRESVDHEQDLSALFGNDHGLDSYATKRRYLVQESAFSQPEAYIRIYQVSA